MQKCKTANEAKKKFAAAYLDKTGNDWDDRMNFTKKPGKYFPIEIDYGNQEALEDLKLKPTSSKLSKPLQVIKGESKRKETDVNDFCFIGINRTAI